ncbi:MAG TPA: sigma-70 family RNA polymerase sigma factor [Gaiellaceae bacterium]|nr:sigma-70 family RNA polymerase sigma factor [Gaiellaceae bacterium]
MQPTAASSELELEALRAGDEAAFIALVRRHHAAMVRVAQIFVGSRSIAEEVAQEAWLAVLNGIDRFEGRSSLKTWLFRIVTNQAKTRAVREGRTIPLSALRNPENVPEPALDPERFRSPEDPRWPGHWAVKPQEWPEAQLLAAETLGFVEAAIEALPPAQRAVVTLRDVEGWTAEEVCNALELTETNQRVLLHRGRSKVRKALEEHLG